MTETTSDERVAAKLAMHTEAVAQAREEWNESAKGIIIRAILEDRLQQQFDEQQRKLRKIKPEELKAIQGQLDGIEQSMRIASQPLR